MSKEIVNYKEALAKLAKEQSAAETPAESRLTVTGGRLLYNGNKVDGDKMDCIVLASTRSNTYFEGAYDADNPQAPVCYAYGTDELTMKPHKASAKPQSDSCMTCPNNEWGSGRGKGKACKNRRILAVLPGDTTDPASAPVATVTLPIMSVQNWANYSGQISAGYNVPTLAVITTLAVNPDPKTQYKFSFQYKGNVNEELIPGLLARREAVMPTLGPVYEVEEEAPANDRIS